jgi:hypothetical protein
METFKDIKIKKLNNFNSLVKTTKLILTFAKKKHKNLLFTLQLDFNKLEVLLLLATISTMKPF